MTRERHPEGEYHVKESSQTWPFVHSEQCCWNVKSQLSTYSYSLLWSPAGKVLIIGGSIANFTNVAATFKVKLLLKTLHNVNFRTLALFKDLFCDCTHATTQTCIFTKACLEHSRSFSPLSWPVLGPQGIVRAIKDYQTPLKEHEVTIFVRRGGPNYQEGLRVMGEVGECCVPSVIYMWIFVLMH